MIKTRREADTVLTIRSTDKNIWKIIKENGNFIANFRNFLLFATRDMTRQSYLWHIDIFKGSCRNRERIKFIQRRPLVYDENVMAAYF